MQGYGQFNLKIFLGKLHDPGDKPDGGNGNPPSTNIDSPLVVDDAQGFEKILIVVKTLPVPMQTI